MHSLRGSLVTLAFLAAAACSDDLSSGTNPPNAAVEETSVYEIALSSDKLPVLQGSSATIEVTLTRKNGFAGAVTVTPAGLPNGALASPLVFEGATTTLTLKVDAAAAAPHSRPTEVSLQPTAANGKAATKLLTVTVHGPPGSLDTSFESGGKVVIPVGQGDDYGYAIAVQPDGKVVVAGSSAENLGDFAIVRLDRDGAPDPTFGSNGKVMTSIGADSDVAYAVALQADGKILVAGSAVMPGTGKDFALARYLPDGQLDASFGSGGKVTTSFTDDADTAYAILVQPDGKIVVAGDANKGASDSGLDFALARYDSAGKLDPSFGSQGKQVTSIRAGSARDSIYALALQDVSGEPCILAAGGEGDFSIARYASNGQLDPRFHGTGKASALFGSVIGAARGIAVTAEGTIVAAGHAEHEFALVKLTSGGELDPTFGTQGTGKVITQVSTSNWDEAQAVAIDRAGRILAGGWVYEGGSSSANSVVIRYDANGRLDPAFGSGGIVVTEVAAQTKSDLANAMILQPDDRVPAVRVLLAGYASTSNYDLAVTRYWAEPLPR